MWPTGRAFLLHEGRSKERLKDWSGRTSERWVWAQGTEQRRLFWCLLVIPLCQCGTGDLWTELLICLFARTYRLGMSVAGWVSELDSSCGTMCSCGRRPGDDRLPSRASYISDVCLLCWMMRVTCWWPSLLQLINWGHAWIWRSFKGCRSLVVLIKGRDLRPLVWEIVFEICETGE